MAFAVAWGASAGAATLGINKPAPDFTATDINGKTVSLAAYKGKIVVLEWADPDCSFDSKHYKSGNIPDMQKKALAQGVVWLSINSAAPGMQGDLSGAALSNWMGSVKWDGSAYIRDQNGTLGHMYHATATPDIYVINKDGVLVYAGAIDNIPSQDVADIKSATNYVTAALQDVMDGKPVAKPVTRAYGCTIKYAGAV